MNEEMEKVKALIKCLVETKSSTLRTWDVSKLAEIAMRLETFIDPIWRSFTDSQQLELVDYEVLLEKEAGIKRPAWGSILDLSSISYSGPDDHPEWNVE